MYINLNFTAFCTFCTGWMLNFVFSVRSAMTIKWNRIYSNPIEYSLYFFSWAKHKIMVIIGDSKLLMI